jgi:hypothetical protein
MGQAMGVALQGVQSCSSITPSCKQTVVYFSACPIYIYMHIPYRPLLKPPKHHTNIAHNSQNIIPTCPHNLPREMLRYSQVATHPRSYQRHTTTHSAAKRTATLGPFCIAAPFF